MAPINFIYVTVILLGLGFGPCDALKVQLFKDLKFKGTISFQLVPRFSKFDQKLNLTFVFFKGLIYEYSTDSPSACHNVEDYGRGLTGSIKSDTCLMLFEEPSCHGQSFKLSLDMPEMAELRRSISSFHPCREDFGGSKIRLAMFDSRDNLSKHSKLINFSHYPKFL